MELSKPDRIVILKDKTSIEYYKDVQVRKNQDGEILVKYLKTTTGRVILNYTINYFCSWGLDTVSKNRSL